VSQELHCVVQQLTKHDRVRLSCLLLRRCAAVLLHTPFSVMLAPGVGWRRRWRPGACTSDGDGLGRAPTVAAGVGRAAHASAAGVRLWLPPLLLSLLLLWCCLWLLLLKGAPLGLLRSHARAAVGPFQASRPGIVLHRHVDFRLYESHPTSWEQAT
jgi:hypothetical protein